MSQLSITILICTHNRAGLLSKALASLNAAQRPVSAYVDILVVPNACDDATHQLLRDYQEAVDVTGDLPMRFVEEPKPGKSHALNRGMVELASQWVAIVDDDQRVAPDFLVQIEEAIGKLPLASMLCGRILPDWNGAEPAWVHDTGPYRVYPLPIPRQDFGESPREIDLRGPIPGGGNQIVKVDLLRQLGGFSTELGPQGHDLGGGEDTDFMLRALRIGARLWYVPEVVQFHHVDTARLTLSYMLRKAYTRSAAAATVNGKVGAGTQKVPPYMYRKLLGYGFWALTAFSAARRRFYLVRCAATMGEMACYRRPASHH